MTKLPSMMATLATLALTAGLAGSSLATDAAEPEPLGVYQIEGITWVLRSQAVEGELVGVAEVTLTSLLMEDGQAGGQGGCNSYFTSYELDGFDLTFGPIGSTLMACPPPLMDAEAAYFENLGRVAGYQSGGIQMAFLDAEGKILLEYDAAPEASIVGSWVASGINDQLGENAGVVSSAVTSEVSADFSPDGDLTGYDGCNDYRTRYQTDGEAITISEAMATTRKACHSDESAEQAEWYSGALASATTWSIDAGGTLQLRDANGSLQVSYLPAD